MRFRWSRTLVSFKAYYSSKFNVEVYAAFRATIIQSWLIGYWRSFTRFQRIFISYFFITLSALHTRLMGIPNTAAALADKLQTCLKVVCSLQLYVLRKNYVRRRGFYCKLHTCAMQGLASRVRSLSTSSFTHSSRVCQALVCTKFGNPEDVLEWVSLSERFMSTRTAWLNYVLKCWQKFVGDFGGFLLALRNVAAIFKNCLFSFGSWVLCDWRENKSECSFLISVQPFCTTVTRF